MAKFKLLKSITQYNLGGGNPPARLSIKYIIPAGTVINATNVEYPQIPDEKFCKQFPTSSPCQKNYQNNYKIYFKVKYDEREQELLLDEGSEISPSYNFEQVPDSTPETLNENIIIKNIINNNEQIKSDTKDETQPEKSKSKILTTNNILIGLAVIAVIGIGYYIIKK